MHTARLRGVSGSASMHTRWNGARAPPAGVGGREGIGDEEKIEDQRSHRGE